MKRTHPAPPEDDSLPAGGLRPAPADRGPAPAVCPTCGRGDALLVIGDVLYCVACGYASDGARGCT